MTRSTLITLLILTSIIGAASGQTPEPPITPTTLVWCGLDYSHVKMIGTQDFREPDKIIPGMMEAWNSLFMSEMLPKLAKMAPGLRTSIAAVRPGNAKLDTRCIVREDGTEAEKVKPTHITEQNIAAVVKAYDIEFKEGLGLVFIMDRLVKTQQTGCLYVVFFDIATRKVVCSQRCCQKAGGIGFRNFWFGPVKRVVKDLPGFYQKAKTAK